MQALPKDTMINELNNEAWALRYVDRDHAMRLAINAKEKAIAVHDQLNVTYARLTIAQLAFWKTADGDHLKEAIESLHQFEKINDPLGISRAHCISAGMYDQYGQYEKAMHHAQQAVKMSRQVVDKENKADCYTVLGQIYSRTHDYSQAIKALRIGLETRKQLKDLKAVASSLNLIGRNFVLSKNYEEAEEYYKESLLLRENIKDVQGIPWTYLGLASLFSEKGDLEMSIEYYNKAEISNQFKEKRFELLCLIGRGKIYLEQANIVSAITNLNKALIISEELKIIALTAEVHQLLSSAYEKNNDFSRSLHHYKCFNDLQQEILSSEKVNMLKHQQIAFSVENAEKEAEIHRLKNIELKNAFDKIAIQHHELEIKNKEITDSIDYAKYIQDAYFPSKELLKKIVPDSFLLYKPKDIVSGDFYWFNQPPSPNSIFLFAAADCTGHGVPGAIMSVICCNALNDVMKKGTIHQPDLILNNVREIVTGAFEQRENYTTQKDGMDIALIGLSPFPSVEKTVKLQYAGAYNPLWVIRKGKPAIESNTVLCTTSHYLIEIKADRQPIGLYERMDPFTLHEMEVYKGDTVYSFSDGYADQFGGEFGEKFKYKPLKELLLAIQDKTMAEQHDILIKAFDDWKQDQEQVDDVCMIGVRI
ncbi:MAG: tetratricopeptide repeat protein [Bacteroidota bacterium]